jgi:uncharacterized membrane protein
MRSAAHIEGHPIHPMLVGFPVAYLFGSTCIDVWARATNRPRWLQTASHMSLLGIGAALAAAVPGPHRLRVRRSSEELGQEARGRVT